jgi:hypothetical protein
MVMSTWCLLLQSLPKINREGVQPAAAPAAGPAVSCSSSWSSRSSRYQSPRNAFAICVSQHPQHWGDCRHLHGACWCIALYRGCHCAAAATAQASPWAHYLPSLHTLPAQSTTQNRSRSHSTGHRQGPGLAFGPLSLPRKPLQHTCHSPYMTPHTHKRGQLRFY